MSELPSASAPLPRGPSTLPSLGEGPATLGTNREGLAEPPSYHLTVRDNLTDRAPKARDESSAPKARHDEGTQRRRRGLWGQLFCT